MTFKKAERKKAKLRLGIAGPSGSGKTWSSLEIATGMGGRIALIDTESGRGELYGEDFDYDTNQIYAPYSPQKYIAAIKEAEESGYDILIIDSLSHAWSGEGGILSIADRAGGNSFTNGWRTATPQHNALVDTIVGSKMHIIITLRVKTDYVLEQNSKGKFEPKKVGLAPIQRDGLEYECTMFMTINQENIAHVNKDNTKLYNQEFIKPTKEMGVKLMEWLNSGKESISDEQQARESIKGADSMDELKTAYMRAYKMFCADATKLSELNALKDERKRVLEKAVNDFSQELDEVCDATI